MNDINTTLHRVQSSGRQAANPETRVVNAVPLNKTIRQGDVYLTRIEELPQGLKEVMDNRQIVPGSSTGSRHVMHPGCRIFVREGASELEGPYIDAPQGFYLGHPKHADVDYRQAGCYKVTFPVDKQADLLGEIRRRRD